MDDMVCFGKHDKQFHPLNFRMHGLVWQSVSGFNRHLNEMPLLLERWHLALEWNTFVPSVVRNFIRVKWWKVPRERGSLSGKKLYYGQVSYQREGGSLSSEIFYHGQIIEGTEREKKKTIWSLWTHCEAEISIATLKDCCCSHFR